MTAVASEENKDLTVDYYSALQRLLLHGWVKASWGTSENNRRARFYTLTTAGRRQLSQEWDEFDRMVLAIHKVLNAT